MPVFQHDGLPFAYREAGSGIPVVLQHGLGGDTGQPFGLFQPPRGFRLLAFDFRAHGETRPLGDPGRINIASFADDLRALIDHLELPPIVVGGISLGAAVALNFTVRFPDRVRGLVLSRPAWLDGPREENVRVYGFIASLIREHGAARGRELFLESDVYQAIARQFPDAAASLVKQFEHPRAEETVIKLERIPRDAPVRDLRALEAIAVPTLVLANRQDPIHPFACGESLAQRIPQAEFRELTPKSVSSERHAAEVQQFIAAFLERHFARGSSPW
jgi:pimeloyl-ACP methyl ester carboxylesterase